ncbi:MAG TPA: hypothetical protein VMF69_02300 [Gemmataceae bacterium]|nr:hypothetical protein [Gemmataceae bacterium]
MTQARGETATDWRRALLRPGHLADLGFAGLLLAILWVVYAPSLEHTPRADQWCFLVDTIDQHCFWDIFAHSYSYNRTRQVMPGDTDLYRPLLFAVLAAEKAVFAADFASYQAVGILLHWGLTCMLLLLLRTILAFAAETSGAASPSPPSWTSRLLPYGVCLFFALNKSVQEMVIWSHLHGYLVFLIFLLASLTLLLRFVRRPLSWKNPLLWGCWVMALLSAFTYEMGQLYAVLAGLFLAVVLPRGTGTAQRLSFCGLFVAIMIFYQGADRCDRRMHEGQFPPENVRTQIKERALSKETIDHSKRFLAYTVAQPFFPSLMEGAAGRGRVVMGEADWTRKHFTNCSPATATAPSFNITYVSRGQEHCVRFPPVLIASMLTACLAIGLGLIGLVRLFLQRDKLSLLMFLLTLGLYGVYLAMTVLGRMNIRPGPHCLSTNSYYGHMGLLLALVPIFALWQAVGRSRAAAAAQAALLLGMIVLTCYSAPAVRRLNESVARDLKGCRESIAALRAFIEDHKDERDFSIAIDFVASDPVGSEYQFPIPTIVFKRWINPDPKYIVTLRDGQVHARRRDYLRKLSASNRD